MLGYIILATGCSPWRIERYEGGGNKKGQVMTEGGNKAGGETRRRAGKIIFEDFKDEEEWGRNVRRIEKE